MDDRIDLKRRLQITDNKKLKGVVSFTVGELNETSLDELAFFADKLEKIGISLEITRKKNTENSIGYDFVVMKLNEEKYRSATTRHAGRKADFEEKYDKYGKCTVDELREMLKTMSKTDVAKELGCSRMTLYRILNNISMRNPAGDTSIWHYTS